MHKDSSINGVNAVSFFLDNRLFEIADSSKSKVTALEIQIFQHQQVSLSCLAKIS